MGRQPPPRKQVSAAGPPVEISPGGERLAAPESIKFKENRQPAVSNILATPHFGQP
jgi:hypothetical protein